MILDQVQTITFSKDRPWQLAEHLRSYRDFTTGLQIILYKASTTEIEYEYNELKELYRNTEVLFFNQSKHINFITALRAAFSLINSRYIAFTVDDVFFYDSYEAKVFLATERMFRHTEDILSMRLHKDCTFCQPASLTNTMPSIIRTRDYNWFSYEPGRGVGDWYYPLEVSASIYHRDSQHIKSFMAVLQDPTIRHPNDLEARWSATAINACEVLFPRKRICSTVTINRVQDDYPNPVGPVTLSVEEGINYYRRGLQMDEAAYRNANFNSIHVNYLALKETNGSTN